MSRRLEERVKEHMAKVMMMVDDGTPWLVLETDSILQVCGNTNGDRGLLNGRWNDPQSKAGMMGVSMTVSFCFER